MCFCVCGHLSQNFHPFAAWRRYRSTSFISTAKRKSQFELRSFSRRSHCQFLSQNLSSSQSSKRDIWRSQELYFQSTNYIFPIVINRKFVLNAKGYWFYQIGKLLILSLRYTFTCWNKVSISVKGFNCYEMIYVRVWGKVSDSLKRVCSYFHPPLIQNVANIANHTFKRLKF